jgi:hypothetical protein
VEKLSGENLIIPRIGMGDCVLIRSRYFRKFALSHENGTKGWNLNKHNKNGHEMLISWPQIGCGGWI